MRASIKMWGNSAAVRIPASVMAAANLRVDSTVDVREKNGRIVVEPVRDDVRLLDRLVERITPENMHSEFGFGARVGKESL